MAVLAAALLLATCAGNWQSPQVDRIDPVGGQRGTEVRLVFTGKRLFEPKGLLLSKPGLEVLEVTGDKPESCTVHLRIAPDCALGSQPLRLRTASGIGNLVLFQVGALTEIAEHRQDEEIQHVPLECAIDGDVGSEEVDRYGVEVAAGTTVHCEVQGMRLGRNAIDLTLTVWDPDGNQIASADDSVLGIKDPVLAFTAPRSGVYVVQVCPAYVDATNAGSYRLLLGTFPRPTGCLPCGGQPGEELDVTLLGDAGATGPVRVRLPDDGEQWFRFHPEDARGITPTPLLLRVGGPLNQTAEVDDKGRAWVTFPGSVHGIVAAPDQSVRFWWKAKKGAGIELRVVARSLRSPLDPLLTVRRADGRYLAANDDGAGMDSVLRFDPPADGDYQIEIRDLLRRGGPDHFFRLEGGPRSAPPNLRMVTGRREDAVLPVARGNRIGAVLQCTDIEGKEGRELVAQDLPAGVTATFGAVQAGTNLVPLLLTAAADAELGGSQVGFLLRDAGVPQPSDPGYAQYVPLVTTRNDQPLLGAMLRQLPVAVVEPLPFAIHVEAPAVPLVRGAPLTLAVRIERAEGFTGPVRLKALWNPPGLGAGQITVDGKTGTAALLLSATAGAMTGRFPFAVVGQAGARGGVVEACSAFVDLQVDEPWLTADIGRARTEPGTDTTLRVKLTPRRPLPGPGRATLLGLPHGVTCEPLPFATDQQELSFALQVAADAAPGRHRSVLVQLLVPPGEPATAGAWVEHRFGGGEIRIDRPTPPVAAPSAPRGEPCR